MPENGLLRSNGCSTTPRSARRLAKRPDCMRSPGLDRSRNGNSRPGSTRASFPAPHGETVGPTSKRQAARRVATGRRSGSLAGTRRVRKRVNSRIFARLAWLPTTDEPSAIVIRRAGAVRGCFLEAMRFLPWLRGQRMSVSDGACQSMALEKRGRFPPVTSGARGRLRPAPPTLDIGTNCPERRTRFRGLPRFFQSVGPPAAPPPFREAGSRSPGEVLS